MKLKIKAIGITICILAGVVANGQNSRNFTTKRDTMFNADVLRYYVDSALPMRNCIYVSNDTTIYILDVPFHIIVKSNNK